MIWRARINGRITTVKQQNEQIGKQNENEHNTQQTEANKKMPR